MVYFKMNALVWALTFISLIEQSTSGFLDYYVNATDQAEIFLTKFGYLYYPYTEATFEQGIIDFQSFIGLNQTGILDEETLILMNTPRCGVQDKFIDDNTARKKRNAVSEFKWQKKDLIYAIKTYTWSLKTFETIYVIYKAFKLWSDVSELTFQATTSEIYDIELEFLEGNHGDGHLFDGEGGVVAHAFYPPVGLVHFDNSEEFTVKKDSGLNLFYIAAHELGHALGLRHSHEPLSVMYPYDRPYDKDLALHPDDISAIQDLYGVGEPEPDVPVDDQILCVKTKVDAIVSIPSVVENLFLVFKGDQYWEITLDEIREGFPKYISTLWNSRPFSRIDAAFFYDDFLYILKNFKCYRFIHLDNYILDTGYPKRMGKCFPGLPEEIDAAVEIEDKIYFFSGSYCYSSEIIYEDHFISQANCAEWFPGFPTFVTQIDAAFSPLNSGKIIFISGDNYWSFDIEANLMDETPPYPESSAGYAWFQCKGNTPWVE